jgi:C-terminal processing protease CtpA/Prc
MPPWSLAALVLAAAPQPGPGALAGDPKYAADVAFLLDGFEQRAGGLLALKKVDWKQVRREFTPLAAEVEDDVAHVQLCARLMARLRDGHASFTKLEVELPEEPRTYGIGVVLCEQGGKVYVKQARGGAAASGVEAGFELVQVDGVKAAEWLDAAAAKLADQRGFSSRHAERYAACHWSLSGPEGTRFELEFARSKPGAEKVTLTCSKAGGDARYVGPVFPGADWQRLGRRDAFAKLPSGFGYVYLGECADGLPAELDQALAALGEVPGLILDLRANNGGGTDHAAVFGRFLAPGTRWRRYEAAGEAHFAGPLVVIVDEGTRSTGETVAGQFKEDGRAYMIGPGPTHGMSAQKAELTVPSGLFSVRFAVSSNKQRFQGGAGIEGIGVAPHEVVAWDPRLLQQGIDPILARAEELLAKGFPKGRVAYEPPR